MCMFPIKENGNKKSKSTGPRQNIYSRSDQFGEPYKIYDDSARFKILESKIVIGIQDIINFVLSMVPNQICCSFSYGIFRI